LDRVHHDTCGNNMHNFSGTDTDYSGTCKSKLHRIPQTMKYKCVFIISWLCRLCQLFYLYDLVGMTEKDVYIITTFNSLKKGLTQIVSPSSDYYQN